MTFADGFVWGVATAAYQIEGATNEGGRGPCVWDMFCQKPGAIADGHNGSEACDHYHRYVDDVALMKELGVGGYRFSFAWPRILPQGYGKPNEIGLDFYDRLIDCLLDAGIEPWAMVFHWDMPLNLYHRGGWLNPDSPKWFGDYSAVLADRFSDRVKRWMTQNEPQTFIPLGLMRGGHAPGDKLPLAQNLLAAHHTLLAHGRGVQAIRANAHSPVSLSIAPGCSVCLPESDRPEDVEAARRGTFAVENKGRWGMGWWLDPIFKGAYPEEGVRVFGADMPPIAPDDMRIISEPIDFLAMNIYHGQRVRSDGKGGHEAIKNAVGRPMTSMKWDVTPECLYWGPKMYFERYGKPMVVTENGLANQDWVSLDGRVHDVTRIDFLHRHLAELERASREGLPIEGYFHWSFMDNFEWSEGYRERFGLVYVDYPTQERIPKDSFYWFKGIIESTGEVRGLPKSAAVHL